MIEFIRVRGENPFLRLLGSSDERRSFSTGILVGECQPWGFATTAADLINSANPSFSPGFT
jgi:hypothetical protein